MTEQSALAPPTTAAASKDNLVVIITCATILILGALGAGGYLLKQELDRMANAKPAAPPELTQALGDLRTQLDQQRTDSATQLKTLQDQLAAVKEKQETQPPPDMNAAIAPVQQKLDAIAAQLEAPPPPPPEAPPAAANPNETLHHYLALRRAVDSGKSYAAELAVLIPELPQSSVDAVNVLQAHAEMGLGQNGDTNDAPATELKPWMVSVNEKMKGLVSIKPVAHAGIPSQARAEVTAALDSIESSLMGGP